MKSGQVNLLDLKPARNLSWEAGQDGRTVLLIPKFRKGLMAKWVQPKLRRPNFRIKLDENGSFIWDLCNGQRTVGEIARFMNEKHGADFDPKYERTGKFITQMLREKFLVI